MEGSHEAETRDDGCRARYGARNSDPREYAIHWRVRKGDAWRGKSIVPRCCPEGLKAVGEVYGSEQSRRRAVPNNALQTGPDIVNGEEHAEGFDGPVLWERLQDEEEREVDQ